MQNSDLKTVGEALKQSEEVSSLTAGCSMRPLFREHKDVVIIKRVDRPLKKGDVVLYPNSSNQYVLHRIMRFKGDTLIIRGDNNYFTEKIPQKNIVGVLKEFYRNGKYVNCETSKGYKCYVFYIMHSYAVRYVWKKIIRRTLSKIKHAVTK